MFSYIAFSLYKKNNNFFVNHSPQCSRFLFSGCYDKEKAFHRIIHQELSTLAFAIVGKPVDKLWKA